MKLYRRRLKRFIKKLCLINCFRLILLLYVTIVLYTSPVKVYAEETVAEEITEAEDTTEAEEIIEAGEYDTENRKTENDSFDSIDTDGNDSSVKRVTVVENCLKVNAVREDGINIILGSDVYYTNCSIMFNLSVNEKADDEICMYEYAAGYDKQIIENCITEEKTGSVVESDNSKHMYKIIPADDVIIDIKELNEGVNYYISFRGITETSEKTLIYYSQIYCICKDTTSPRIDFYSEKELEEWSNEPISLRIDASDKEALHCLKVVSDGVILEEVFYDNLSKVRSTMREITLFNEADGNNGCDVEVICSDKAGNERRITHKYYIDYSAPIIEINGPANEINRKNVFVEAKWSDTMMDTAAFYYSVSRDYQGQTFLIEDNTITSSDFEGMIRRNYSIDGDYHITCFAYDIAGNRSETREIRFIIDTHAPVIEYDGVSDGGKYTTDKNIGIYINDDFYESMEINAVGYREAGGYTEKLDLERMRIYSINNRSTYCFAKDGIYRIEIRATDAAGNSSVNNITFKIDKTAPDITLLNGDAKDGMLINRYPTLNFNVYETFYDTTEIDIELYRTDGDKYIRVPYENERMNSESHSFPVIIKDEGSYELIIRAVDECGGSDAYRIKFVVDVTPPIIGFLDEISMKYLGKFILPEEFGNYIYDSSKISYRAYLNSDNYLPGTTISKTGKYYLRIEAVDEAGNKSDKTVEFIVDSDKPEIVISGLRKDGSARINNAVEISLRNPQDYITYYSVNGIEMNLDKKMNQVDLVPKRYGKYELHIKAEDLTGNVSEENVTIRCSAFGGLTNEKAERYMNYNVNKNNEIGYADSLDSAGINETDEIQDCEKRNDDNFSVILFSLYSVIGPVAKGIKKVLNNT